MSVSFVGDSRVLRVLVMAGAIIGVVSGCSSDVTPRQPSASASTPATPASSRSPLADPSPAGVPRNAGPCAAATPSRYISDDDEPEQLGGMSLPIPIDRGPLPHANGVATFDDRGVPVAYVVASDDNLVSIGSRFCLDGIYLYWVNAVRRDDDTLFVGDVINLDAHTIGSVGSQNGAVYTHPFPPFRIPPQR